LWFGWGGVVWCGVVWLGWCGVVWLGWCGVVWCGVVWCGIRMQAEALHTDTTPPQRNNYKHRTRAIQAMK